MEGIRITKLQRDPEGGFWTANVSNGDRTLPVHHKFGSWMTWPNKEGIFQDVHPLIAAELTAKMRREEKREKNGGEPDPQDLSALADTNPFVKKALKQRATA
jgi:hypothetical protein